MSKYEKKKVIPTRKMHKTDKKNMYITKKETVSEWIYTIILSFQQSEATRNL
jgi:hypothetical protein